MSRPVMQVRYSEATHEFFVYITDVGGEETLDYVVDATEPQKAKDVIVENLHDFLVSLENDDG